MVERRRRILANGTSFPLSALCQETPSGIMAADYNQVMSGVRDRRQLLINPPHQTARLLSSLLPVLKSSFQIVKCHSNLEHLTPSLGVQLTPGIKVRCIMDPLYVKVK